VHYRGTDKNIDLGQSNPVSAEEFVRIINDFLVTHKEITTIFVATGDAHFLKAIGALRKVVFYPQLRSTDGSPIWKNHTTSNNQAVAKDAILDCLTLSRCHYLLKSMSALSAFSKVINPNLQAYRISACKRNWFPEDAVPLYHSSNDEMQKLLRRLQRGDINNHGTTKISDLIVGFAHTWLNFLNKKLLMSRP
jgi:hypothetical protein